ncbi:hypothetical protein BASA81_009848 [Batrachochytrium salamandrivorans]|nr:hypothetical protein BASA81_009848 [Batrachochytrium salamandrivorans]
MAKSTAQGKPLVKSAKPVAAEKKSEPEAKKPRLANIEFADDTPSKKSKKDKDKPKKEKKPAVEKKKPTPKPVEKEARPQVKKEPKHPKKPLTEQQRTGIFKKTLVGISSGACEEGGAGEELSFTQVKNEVQELGAEIAQMLLVNGTACKRNTQKVRKAQKLKVPLVRAQDYLKACKAAGKKLPVNEFLAELED